MVCWSVGLLDAKGMVVKTCGWLVGKLVEQGCYLVWSLRAVLVGGSVACFDAYCFDAFTVCVSLHV